MKNILLVFIAFIGLSLMNISCSNTIAQEQSEAQEANEVVASEQIEAEVVQEKVVQIEQLVKVSTEYGDMVIKLYNETPLHRDNFIKLAKEGFYNGTIFHRVISGFMIQGGDPETRNAVPNAMYGNGGPGYTVPAEFNKALFHKKGALAAARTGGPSNPQKESSGSQFYIVQGKKYTNLELNTMEQQMGKRMTAEQKEAYMSVGGVPFLDMEYTVYGEVITGLEVIDSIAAVKIQGERPIKDVKMTVSFIEE